MEENTTRTYQITTGISGWHPQKAILLFWVALPCQQIIEFDLEDSVYLNLVQAEVTKNLPLNSKDSPPILPHL